MFGNIKKKRSIIEYAYYVSLVFPFLLIAIMLYFVSPLCLFALPCIWVSVKYVSGYFFARTPSKNKVLKKANSQPSETSAVLVVICSILRGEEDDRELFDRLELIYNANSGRNIYFGILGDLCDFRCAKASSDERVLSYAYGRIDALNKKYGKNFVLLERPRSYSKGEDIFMPGERRRGAVTELVNYLRGRDNSFSEKSCILSREVLSGTKIKYIITLDKDTEIPLDAVKSMYEYMQHGTNKPEIHNGKVAGGYAVMQPFVKYRCKTETAFSKIFCESENSKNEQRSRQNIFGKADFSGNGIIDVDCFTEVFGGICSLPEDTVLSQTFPEGALLRTAYLSQITIIKEFPENTMEYLKIRHRNVREDIQNLRFLFEKSVLFKSTEIRFQILDKVICDFAVCFAFLCIFISAFLNETTRNVLLSASLSYLFLPVIFGFISAVYSILKKRRDFFKKLYCLPGAIFSLSMLAQESLCIFDASVKSLYRLLVSKRKLLEKSYDSEEAVSAGLLDFVHRNIFSAFSSFLLFAFAAPGILRIISLLWLSFPVLSHLASFKSNKAEGKTLSGEKSYALATRVKSIAEANTDLASPKGIGLNLLSFLVLRDFGFITTEEMRERISCSLSLLLALPKWRGLVFERYDIESMTSAMPQKIASAEIGALCACLITLREGLREYVCESTSLIDIISQIEKLEGSMDIMRLFDCKKNLFYRQLQVYDGKSFIPSENHLAGSDGSAILLGYIACARRLVSKEHSELLLKSRICNREIPPSDSLLPYIFLPFKKNRNYYRELLSFDSQKNRAEIYLALLCNEGQENRLCKRFSRDVKMGCAKYLLY